MADLEELSRAGLQVASPWTTAAVGNGGGGHANVIDENDAIMMQRAALNTDASAGDPACVADSCASQDEAALKDLQELERAGLVVRWTR